jgi:hypothetical protein
MAYQTLSRTGFPGPIGVTEQRSWPVRAQPRPGALSRMPRHSSPVPKFSPSPQCPTYSTPNTEYAKICEPWRLTRQSPQSSRLQCEAVSVIQPIPMTVRLKISTDAIERSKVIPLNNVGGLVQLGQGFPLAGTHASRQHWSLPREWLDMA